MMALMFKIGLTIFYVLAAMGSIGSIDEPKTPTTRFEACMSTMIYGLIICGLWALLS